MATLQNFHHHESRDNTIETVQILNCDVPVLVESCPVLVTPRSMPPHAVVNPLYPLAQSGCPKCTGSPARLTDPTESSLVERCLLTAPAVGCTCVEKPSVPDVPHPPRQHATPLPYPCAYETLPPAFPIHPQSCTITNRPLVPGDPVISMTQYNAENVVVSHYSLISLRLLQLTVHVIPYNLFFTMHSTVVMHARTFADMSVALTDDVSSFQSPSPSPYVNKFVKYNILSLCRIFRDIIIKTDAIVENIRAHTPLCWWDSRLYTCSSLSPFTQATHDILYDKYTLLCNAVRAITVFMEDERPTSEHFAAASALLGQTVTSARLADPNIRSRTTYDFLQLIHLTSKHVSHLMLVSLRRFYLAAYILHGYKYCLNSNLLQKLYDYDILRGVPQRLRGSIPRPSHLSSTYSLPNILSSSLHHLLRVRSEWSFDIPAIVYSPEFDLFYAEDLDYFRKNPPLHFLDTCSILCLEQCVCSTFISAVSTSHQNCFDRYPSRFPFVQISHSKYHPSVIPSSPPDPPPLPPLNPYALSFLADSPEPGPSAPSQQTPAGGSAPETPQVPDNPHPVARPRRPFLRDITHTLNLSILLLLTSIFFSMNVNVTGFKIQDNFIFDDLSNDIIVNTNNVVVPREINFQVIKESLKMMRQIGNQYNTACKTTVSDFQTSFYSLYANSPPTNTEAFCVAHKLLSPTLEFPEEVEILAEHMLKNNLSLALSPYMARGPGHLHLTTYVQKQDTILFAQPMIPIEPLTTAAPEVFHSVYQLVNGSLTLKFFDNTTDSPLESLAGPLPVICKYLKAPIPIISDVSQFIENLCSSDHRQFAAERARLSKLLKVIQPSYLHRLERTMPRSLMAQAIKDRRKDPKNDPSLGNIPFLLRHLTSLPRRTKRAAVALVALGAGLALVVSSLILGIVNKSAIDNIESRIDEMTSSINQLKLVTSETQKQLLALANRQRDDMLKIQEHISDVVVSMNLLQLRDDHNFLATTVQNSIDTFLTIRSFAANGLTHESLLEKDFLQTLLLRENLPLSVDPRDVKSTLFRTKKKFYIVLEFPIIDPSRAASLYKLTPLPIFSGKNKFTPENVPPYVLFLHSSPYFTVLDPFEASLCQSKPLDCRPRLPFQPATSKSCGPPSFYNLNSSHCTYSVERDNTPFFYTLFNNTAFSVHDHGAFTLYCRDPLHSSLRKTNNFFLQHKGVVALKPSCLAETTDKKRIFPSERTHLDFTNTTPFDVGTPFSTVLHNLSLTPVNLTAHDRLIADIKESITNHIWGSSRLESFFFYGFVSLSVLILLVIMYFTLKVKLQRFIKKEIRKLALNNLSLPLAANNLAYPRRPTWSPPSPPLPTPPTPSSLRSTEALDEIRALRSFSGLNVSPVRARRVRFNPHLHVNPLDSLPDSLPDSL